MQRSQKQQRHAEWSQTPVIFSNAFPSKMLRKAYKIPEPIQMHWGEVVRTLSLLSLSR
jgi:hypothetical protein